MEKGQAEMRREEGTRGGVLEELVVVFAFFRFPIILGVLDRVQDTGHSLVQRLNLYDPLPVFGIA